MLDSEYHPAQSPKLNPDARAVLPESRNVKRQQPISRVNQQLSNRYAYN